MKSTTRQKWTWLPTVVAALIISMGAMMKLAGAATIVEIYSRIGLLPYMRILGIAELVFVALFIYPATFRIGFFLLTGYFGGAMAVEMANGQFFIFPGSILTIVWVAAYLRDRSIFRSRISARKVAIF